MKNPVKTYEEITKNWALIETAPKNGRSIVTFDPEQPEEKKMTINFYDREMFPETGWQYGNPTKWDAL